MGQPDLPPGRVRAELPRLRHPELPRRGPAFRDARGVPRLRRAAHEQGIYVILDIIAHHTGNVFTYARIATRRTTRLRGRWYNDPRWDGKPYAVQGFNDRDGRPTLPFGRSPDAARLEAAWPDGAVWPREFQRPAHVPAQGTHHQLGLPPGVCRGRHVRPEDPRPLGAVGRAVSPGLFGAGLPGLVYCFWIAYADLDGFRIDAAKHMGERRCGRSAMRSASSPRASARNASSWPAKCRAAASIAWEVVEKTGLDAALGIEDVPGKLERMVTGYAEPADYFSLFRNWMLDEPGPGTAGTATRWSPWWTTTIRSARGRPSGGSAATAASATWPST